MPALHHQLQDEESFSNFFTRTQLTIFRFIYGLCGGPIEEVEDLTSETYMRAWNGRNRFSGDQNDALCWLFTIARHLVIDTFRKKQNQLERSTQQLDETFLQTILSSSQYSPEESTVVREQYIYLWKLLQSLPYDRREMIVLRYVVGWQVKQIASYLEMEENTVTIYIRRSLNQIRRDWKLP